MKLFHLININGIAKTEDLNHGRKVVAECCEFSNGKVVVCWLSDSKSVVVWESLQDMKNVNVNQHTNRLLESV